MLKQSHMPHAFRYVIATDHLGRDPGDYLTVATLLHDKQATVLKSYGHLRVDDGLRVLFSGIREASAQLAHSARRRSFPTGFDRGRFVLRESGWPPSYV